MLSACLFVFMACLFVIWLVCEGFGACHKSSTTGLAKKVPDPMACQDGHYDLSVTSLSCRGFHNQLTIFPPFFLRSYDFCNQPKSRRVGYRASSSGSTA